MNNIQISEDYSKYLDNLKKLIIKVDLLNISKSNKEEKENQISALKELYNKMFLYQLYKNKNLIAITGLQGAGKTTLTKDYFNIPEDILPENSSRGEKLPVFLTVDDVQEIEIYSYSKVVKDDKTSIICEKITKEEIQEILLYPDESKDLWVQLVIPKDENHFNDPSTYVVLLPGFEKKNNDFSQKLLEFIVNISKSSIVVIDKNEHARKSSTVNLKRIENKFENLKPIIALTHGDERPEENNNIKQDIIERLKINDEKRVIVTGPKGIFERNWHDELTKLLNDYSGYENNGNEVRNIAIQDILYDIYSNLEELDFLLEDEVKNLEINNYIDEKNNSVKIFKKEYEDYLKKLENALNERMNPLINEKTDEVAKFLEENSSFLKNIKIRTFGKKLTEEIQFKNQVKDIWEGRKDNTPTLVSMNNVAKKQLETFNNIFTLSETNIANEVYEKALKKQNNRIDKINSYFGNSEELETLEVNDIRGLVYIGANLMVSSFESLENNNNSKKIENLIKNYEKVELEDNNSNKDDNIKINLINSTTINTKDEFSKKLQNEKTKKIVGAIPLIFGVDILADGKSDIVENTVQGAGNLSKVLGHMNISISSKALLSVAGFSCATVITGFAIVQNFQDMNKRHINVLNNANLFIESLAKSQINGYVNSLRNVYETIEEKMIFKHSLLKDNREHSLLEQSQYLLTNVKNMTDKSLERSQYEEILF